MSKSEGGQGGVSAAIQTQTKMLGVLIVAGFLINLFRRPPLPPAGEVHPGTFSLNREKRRVEFLPDGSDSAFSIAELAAKNSKIQLLFQLSSHPAVMERAETEAAVMENATVGGHDDTLLALSASLGQYANAVANIRGSASCCKN